MTTNNFQEAFKFTLPWEIGPKGMIDGGYTNDPDDPGGETKWGISKRAYPHLDIKNLTLAQACDLYDHNYWQLSGCDSLPLPLAAVVFDTAVNCGVGRAKEWLQQTQDIQAYLELRRIYYITISDKNPKLKKYLNDNWLKRVNDLHKFVNILEQDYQTV